MAWDQNFYNPINRQKYIGINQPFYRSGWERKYFYELDSDPNVVRWGSEIVQLPYQFNLDNKKHTYYIDIYFEKMINGNLHKVLIEIKPFDQLFPPELPKKRTYKSLKNYNYRMVDWNKNVSKWKFAESFSSSKGMEFYILTEKGVFKYGNLGPYKVSDKTYF